jgi:hypothetical protein
MGVMRAWGEAIAARSYAAAARRIGCDDSGANRRGRRRCEGVSGSGGGTDAAGRRACGRREQRLSAARDVVGIHAAARVCGLRELALDITVQLGR